MAKKIISLLTLGAFLVFEYSCTIYATKKTVPESLTPEQKREMNVTKVLKATDDIIEFPKNIPASIISNAIEGFVVSPEIVEVNEADVRNIKKIKNFMAEIAMKDGATFIAAGYKREKTKIFIWPLREISIPLKDVRLIWLVGADKTLSFFATLGLVAVIAGVAFWIYIYNFWSSFFGNPLFLNIQTTFR